MVSPAILQYDGFCIVHRLSILRCDTYSDDTGCQPRNALTLKSEMTLVVWYSIFSPSSLHRVMLYWDLSPAHTLRGRYSSIDVCFGQWSIHSIDDAACLRPR
ncbi:hypothetical protein PISMIDRAFT_679807 [Pisolithus microcarpus 441]|uniref:Uncharacterized protein n=1 Tax=Pisolithus microcarpus 441 TaxID=765257 RepID=A0A0C9ZA01_9AGAM|nr:hypothetical protein PISMIDRAFT_679807 [Pisolithus microcarpus 441]